MRDAVALLPEEIGATPMGSVEDDHRLAAEATYLTASVTHDDMDTRRGPGSGEASMGQNRITPGLTSTPSFPPGSSPHDSTSTRKRYRQDYHPPYSDYPPHSSNYHPYPPQPYHSQSSGSHQAYGPPVDIPPYSARASEPYDRPRYEPPGYCPPYPHSAYTPSSSGRPPERSPPYYSYGQPPPPEVYRSGAPPSGPLSPRDPVRGYEYPASLSGPPPHERPRPGRHSYPGAEFNPPPPAPGMYSPPPPRWKRKSSPPESTPATTSVDHEIDTKLPANSHHRTPSNDYRSSFPPHIPPPRYPGALYHPGSPYSTMYHPGSPPPPPPAVFPYASSPPLRRPRSLVQGGRQESSATQSSRSLFGDDDLLLQGDLLESDHENSPNTRGRPKQQQQPGEPTATAAAPSTFSLRPSTGASGEGGDTTVTSATGAAAEEPSNPPSTPPQPGGS